MKTQHQVLNERLTSVVKEINDRIDRLESAQHKFILTISDPLDVVLDTASFDRALAPLKDRMDALERMELAPHKDIVSGLRWAALVIMLAALGWFGYQFRRFETRVSAIEHPAISSLTVPECKDGQVVQWNGSKYVCAGVIASTVCPPNTICTTDDVVNPMYADPKESSTGGIQEAIDSKEGRFRVELPKACWHRISEGASVIFEGSGPEHNDIGYRKGLGTVVSVRSGCPGAVSYYVDGKLVHPENKSGTPDKSEVVEVTL
jgi:hypothetical protein